MKNSLLASCGLLLPTLLGACNATDADSGMFLYSNDTSVPAVRHEGNPEITAPANLGKDAFAINVFRDVVAERKGNVVFSPASLENLLDLLKQGARGTTLAALEKAPMGRKGVKSAMQVESADALFIADDLKLKPVAVKDIQRVSVANPGAAAAKVNSWCKDKTHGLIPSLVSPGDFTPTTRMIALNAVYLKEEWLRPFRESATDADGRFHSADGSTATVPMMHQKNKFLYAEGSDWQAVALFYATHGRAGEPGCFIGILPKGDARKFAATLTPEKYNAIRSALAKTRYEDTRVTLPKMEVDTQAFPLKNALTKNGLGVLFRGADFTGFADEALVVDSVVQRCHVMVDEKKTEAAAVTGARVRATCVAKPEQPHVITFDRPFIWAIDDLTTGSAPYFMGLFEKP